MVDEGMRLAKDFSAFREAAYRIDGDEWWNDFEAAESLLRAHLERMAAMAAPQPVAREPMSIEKSEEIWNRVNKTALTEKGIRWMFARAIEREIAQGEKP